MALRLAHDLRDAGRRVTYDLAGRSVGRQFKAANQAGAERVIVIGPDEAQAGEVVVRSMESGEEARLPLEALLGG